MELREALMHLSKNQLIELLEKYIDTLSIKQKNCQYAENTICEVDLRHLILRNPNTVQKISKELDNVYLGSTSQQSSTRKPKIHRFTEREKQVLTLLSEGKSSKEIAQELFISINTVRNHRASMLLKANASNTVQLLGFIRVR